MKKIFLTAIILVGACSLFSQKIVTFKEYCGLYYKTMDDLLQQKGKELSFYDFVPDKPLQASVPSAVTGKLHLLLQQMTFCFTWKI